MKKLIWIIFFMLVTSSVLAVTGYKTKYNPWTGKMDWVVDESSLTTTALTGVNWDSFSSGSVSQWTTNGTAIHYPTGSVGIGSSSPQYKLDVNGSVGLGTTTNSARSLVVSSSSGYVGIGTATVNYPLDVNGVVNGTGLSISGTPIVQSQWTTSGSDIYYKTGNVGIGTTANSTTLSVIGTVGIGTTVSSDSLQVSGSTRLKTAGGVDSLYANSIGNIGIGNTVPNQKVDITGTLVASANIGIGTTNPSTNLQVNGTLRTQSPTVPATTGIVVDSSQRVGIGTSVPSVQFQTGGLVSMKTTGGIQGLYQDNAGKVSIGDTAPQQVLDVNGNSLISGKAWIGSINVVPADSYTKLICHWGGTNGSSPASCVTGQVVTPAGGATISSTQAKFSSTSLSLNKASTQYVNIPDSDDWNFGSGDFTLDGWYYLNTRTTVESIWFQSITGGYNQVYIVNNGAVCAAWIDGAGVAKAEYCTVATGLIATGQWYHIAFVRNGTNFYIFVDGVPKALTTYTAVGTNTLPDYTSVLSLGYELSNSRYLVDGYIDEPRVSKGIARWTADFSASLPTEYTPLDAGKPIPNNTLDVVGSILMQNSSSALGFFQNTSANIGIGTTNPLYKVDIVGSVGIGSTSFAPNRTLYVSPNTNRVGIGTTAPSDKLQVNGGARFASSSNPTDYTQFEDDGTMVMYGNATVWEDLRVDHNPASAVNAPSITTTFGSRLDTYSDEVAHEDQQPFVAQLPHSWKVGSRIYPHVHWALEDGTSCNVAWGLNYRWTNINATDSGVTIGTVITSANLGAGNHNYGNWSAGIDGTGKTLSSIITGVFYRNSTNALDTCESKNAYTLDFDIHYELDSTGSRQELAK